MKHIIAYIKPSQLSKVTLALHEIEGLTGASISETGGFGRGREGGGSDSVSDFSPRIRIEIFCSDAHADEIVSTIESNAHTGLRGDGKIYVCEVSDAVRISNGERGEKAV